MLNVLGYHPLCEKSSQFNGLPRIIGGSDLVAHQCTAFVQQEHLGVLSQPDVSDRTFYSFSLLFSQIVMIKLSHVERVVTTRQS